MSDLTEEQERYDSEQHVKKLLEAAQLGDAIEREIAGSRAVRLILDKADGEKRQAIKDFADVDPTDMKAVIEIQGTIRRANAIGQWLIDAMAAGRDAVALLPDADEETAAETGAPESPPDDQQQT